MPESTRANPIHAASFDRVVDICKPTNACSALREIASSHDLANAPYIRALPRSMMSFVAKLEGRRLYGRAL